VPAPKVLHLIEGARRARGVAVVIDVFRAFTVAPLVLSRGARALHVVASPEEALELKARHPGWLLVGEVEGMPLPGFDLPNSPSAIMDSELSGRTVVLRTSSGVQGVLAARDAEEVIAAGFANAAAVVEYLRALRPAQLSFVCMGWSGREITDDDVACAEYLAAGLEGAFPDFGPFRDRLRADPSGAKFFDPQRPWFPARDFGLCTRPSWLGVVPRLDRSGAVPALVPAARDVVLGKPG
jgi:2-phosphosulfolactate phosphatase